MIELGLTPVALKLMVDPLLIFRVLAISKKPSVRLRLLVIFKVDEPICTEVPLVLLILIVRF